jgi:(+)-pinoresinol hydroxylase
MNHGARFRFALAVTLVGACLSNAFADPASSTQSAWKGSSLKSDASLKDPLLRRGKEVFDARCQVCHGAYTKNASQGSNFYALPQMPGTLAMELKYKGQKPALLEERRDLTPEFVAFFVRRGGGGSMPFFRPTEVSDDDLKALGAYLSRKR